MSEVHGKDQAHGSDPEPGESPESSSRQSRKKCGSCRLLIRLIAFSSVLLALYLIWQFIVISRYGFQDDGRNADCAIVLGGAAWHNKPSPVFKERLNHAIKLYLEGRAGALVLTGGKGAGAPYSEGEVAHEYCLERNIPQHVLFMEGNSTTTIQNIQEARKILTEQNFQSALVVSDPWHLKRGVLIARRQGLEAAPSGTRTSRFQSLKYRTRFTLRELYLYHRYLILNR